jgi:phenylacetic acid degradation operon negative regulatory protein
MARRSDWEDFLLTLLWGAEKFLNPSFNKMFQSFESWEQRQGLQRRWQQLEERKLVVRDKQANQLVYRLTTEGRTAVMGGVNVVAAWDRSWDGRWRMVLFDLPERDPQLRVRLWRWLRTNRFGYLQGSVWVHPDSVDEVTSVLVDFRDDVESLTVMEAVCAPGGENRSIVDGAWDFKEINKRHQEYIQSYVLAPRDVARLRVSSKALDVWLRRERTAWRHAIQFDPLLPRVLWPRSYQGEIAWQTRLRSFALLAY